MTSFFTLLANLAKNPLSVWSAINIQSKIGVGTLIFSILIYFYIVDFYGEDLNVFKLIKLSSNHYNFYSGDRELTYYQIGDYLAKNPPDKIRISNIETNGGYENAIKVLTEKEPSLGLVQEDILSKDDFIKEHIDFITPLYLERLHIIYKKAKLEEVFKGQKNARNKVLEISTSTSLETLKFLSRSKINIGPVGSGSKVLSSYIMTIINTQLNDASKNSNSAVRYPKPELSGDDFKTTLEKLEHQGVDVAFFMIGCTSEKVRELLDHSNDYGLIGLDISLINSLNHEFDLNLKITNFSEKYGNKYKDVTTVGTYSYLVADKNVLRNDIAAILEKLDVAENPSPRAELIELFSDFKFLTYFEKRNNVRFFRTVRNILVFIMSFLTTSTLALIFLTWYVSNTRQNKYLNKISKIINLNIPNNTEFNKDVIEEDEEIIRPLIRKNQKIVINNVIKGQRYLNLLRTEVSNDKGLTDSHFSFIINRIDQIMEKLRKSLFIRLHELKIRNELDLSTDDLRKFLTSDWITYDDFKRLTS